MSHNLPEQMKKKGLWDVDQFPHKAWEPDNEQAIRSWNEFSERISENKPEEEEAFNFRLNLVDSLQPFVNKRGVRKSPFLGQEHEVRLVQVDLIPGYAKLIYRNHKVQVGAIVDVELRSKETIRCDVESVSKALFKQAKRKLRGKV